MTNGDLVAAARDDKPQMVEAVLGRGLDINEVDIMGYTSLHWAIANSNLELAKYLVAQGASTEVENRMGKTAEALCRMLHSGSQWPVWKVLFESGEAPAPAEAEAEAPAAEEKVEPAGVEEEEEEAKEVVEEEVAEVATAIDALLAVPVVAVDDDSEEEEAPTSEPAAAPTSEPAAAPAPEPAAAPAPEPAAAPAPEPAQVDKAAELKQRQEQMRHEQLRNDLSSMAAQQKWKKSNVNRKRVLLDQLKARATQQRKQRERDEALRHARLRKSKEEAVARKAKIGKLHAPAASANLLTNHLAHHLQRVNEQKRRKAEEVKRRAHEQAAPATGDHLNTAMLHPNKKQPSMQQMKLHAKRSHMNLLAEQDAAKNKLAAHKSSVAQKKREELEARKEAQARAHKARIMEDIRRKRAEADRRAKLQEEKRKRLEEMHSHA